MGLRAWSRQHWLAVDVIIAIGFVVSFIVAFIVVKTFIDFIGRYGLKPFGWYRVAVGVILLAALLTS